MPQVCHTPNSMHTVVEQKLESTLGRKLINELSLEKGLFTREQNQRREYQLTLTRERDLGRHLNRNSPDHCLLCLKQKQPHLGEQKGKKAKRKNAIVQLQGQQQSLLRSGRPRTKRLLGTSTRVKWGQSQQRTGLARSDNRERGTRPLA